jgi:aminoglycoside phosphotransferase (APT) family kinase protein
MSDVYTGPMSPSSETSDPQTQYLRQIAADILSADAANIDFKPRPPLDIQSNCLYEASDGAQRIILKQFLKPDEFGESPLREYRALELLSPLDIAPQPRAYLPHRPDQKPIVVYDYMEGQMWDRRIPTAAELGQLSDLWIQLSEIESDTLWLSRNYEQSTTDIWKNVRRMLENYSSWTESSFEPAIDIAQLCSKVGEQRLEIVEELYQHVVPLCFCRSDPRFANVISRPGGRLGMVDWEDSGLRDPALDLADIMTHPNQEDLLSTVQWKAFLSPYFFARGRIDSDLSQRLHLYQGLLPVWWMAILLNEGMKRFRTGQLTKWRIHGMSPNNKLHRYLARALAWPDFDFEVKISQEEENYFFPF